VRDEPAERDEELARRLDAMLDAYRRGDSPDWSSIMREAPELVDELRSLWDAALVTEAVAVDCGPAPIDVDHGAESPVAPQPPPIHDERNQQAQQPAWQDYRIDEEIGRGGMGVVYRAWQFSLRREVAIKRILRGELASAVDVARFRAEAESAAKLHHPNIISIYEVGTHAGLPYFTMPYVRGMTLAERIAKGPMPSREAAQLLLPVCRAIAHAHRHGILHRDLKPSNILIDMDGVPLVTDFGLAKWLGTLDRYESDDAERSATDAALTFSGAILGTPGYLSPEQAAGRRAELGPRSDVYGLGAILYAMLTGRPPFQAASPLETVLMVREQDPVPPSLLNPRTDRELEMIVLKCLQKPPELRYGDADELADDLERFLASEPVAARSSHFGQIISRTFRETHHASVLKNWGLLWMWHSLVLILLCVTTNIMLLRGVTERLPYLLMWGGGMSLWAAVFWRLRRRSGPVSFVERQIAHLWAGSMIADMFLFAIEWQLDLPVLTLSPVLALIGGSVFLSKAVLLSGTFYVPAAILFVTSVAMSYLSHGPLPDLSISLFGVVLAGAFFFPGLKYYRQARRE